MKVILLLLVVLASGEGSTVAILHNSEEECLKAKVDWLKKIAKHNAEDANKIAKHAMECVELKKSPQGYES